MLTSSVATAFQCKHLWMHGGSGWHACWLLSRDERHPNLPILTSKRQAPAHAWGRCTQYLLGALPDMVVHFGRLSARYCQSLRACKTSFRGRGSSFAACQGWVKSISSRTSSPELAGEAPARPSAEQSLTEQALHAQSPRRSTLLTPALRAPGQIEPFRRGSGAPDRPAGDDTVSLSASMHVPRVRGRHR